MLGLLDGGWNVHVLRERKFFDFTKIRYPIGWIFGTIFAIHGRTFCTGCRINEQKKFRIPKTMVPFNRYFVSVRKYRYSQTSGVQSIERVCRIEGWEVGVLRRVSRPSHFILVLPPSSPYYCCGVVGASSLGIIRINHWILSRSLAPSHPLCPSSNRETT